MILIKQDFIPRGRRNRPGYKLTPRYITIHDTSNMQTGADAASHAHYLKGDGAASIPASWHFTVDGGTDKKAPSIYQHLPLNENGWHCGDGTNGVGNRQSIGVEICENKDGNRAVAEKNAAWLTAKLLRDFGLGMSAVKQHYDWSKKNCPHILRTGNKWAVFLEQVNKYLNPVVKNYTVVKEIDVYVNGKKQEEVGLLINDNQTRVSAKFTAGLLKGGVVGEGDRISFTLPADKVADLEGQIEALRGESRVLKFKIETAKNALS